MTMKLSWKLCGLFGFIAANTYAANPQMTFEGLKNQEQIADFYNGGKGGGQFDETGKQYGTGGSTGGANYGVSFGGQAIAVVAEDAGGTGRFANNPSGATVLSFNNVIKGNSIMNVAGGFGSGIGFWYSQPFYATSITVYDGLNATGKVLATLNMAQSATNCPVDKANNSVANCWTATGIAFTGVAKSVDFSNANFTAFDNLVLGSPNSTPVPAFTTTNATCPIANGVSSFILEHPIDAFSFSSSFIPTFAPAQLAVFFDPTKVVHTHFEYNSTTNIVQAWSIGLPIGSPPITPQGYDFAGNAIAVATVTVDRIYTSCTPRPTIFVTGWVASSTPVYGSLAGLPHLIAFSFDPTKTAYNVQNVATVDAGTTAIIGPEGSAIVVPAAARPSNQPAPPATTAVVTGGPVIQTIYRENVLDGSASIAASPKLTYKWSAQGNGIAILDATSAQTRVQVEGLQGDYPVTLTVTDSSGATASTPVTIRFIGR